MNSVTILPLAAFVTPAFLWAGLALVSIPILIHLLNRRRFKVVQWAAMEYLLAAMRKNRRRVKFEQMVLLATRCLILALLGMALARPLGCTDSTLATLAGSRSGMHVFVIDNSYSMAYEADRPGARTHLDQAKILVKQQIARLAAGSESVAIIAAARPQTGSDGAPESMVIYRPGFDLEAAKGAVDRLEQSFDGTDMVKALAAAVELANGEQKQPQKYLSILTDSTRSAWEPQVELLKETGKQIASAFGPRVRYNDLSKAGQFNYAVLDVRPDSSLVTPNFHTDFLADIKGFGQGPEAVVQWKWDEQILGDSQRLKPEAASEPLRQTKLQLKEGQGGPHLLTVSVLDDERLKLDNLRQRVVEVAAELRVLIVEGERGTGLLSGSGAFLDLALAPKKDIGPGGTIRSDSYVAPEVISDLEFGNKVLGDYKAVILTNVASVSPAQADQVEKFVQQGGTLMLFMGDQVNPDAYNGVLLPRKLVPGKLVVRKTATDAKGFTFDFKPNSPLHPLLNIFRGEQQSGLDTAPIYTYMQTELAPETKAEVVLKYLSGEKETNDPAITVHSVGKGRVVMVTTTANGDWNNLPPKPAFIALMHELLAGTVNVGDRWMNLNVGQVLEVPAGLKLTSPPTLTDSAKKQVPIEAVTSSDGQVHYRSKALVKPGVYQLGTGGNNSMPIAVNVPSDEADVRTLPVEAIRKNLGDIEMSLFQDTMPDSAMARDDSNDLGWTVMMLVLALAACECFMAMRFGHYRRKAPIVAATK